MPVDGKPTRNSAGDGRAPVEQAPHGNKRTAPDS